jgi:hypothetical protein
MAFGPFHRFVQLGETSMKLFIASMSLAVGLAVSTGASAATKASTKDLPAALRVLRPSQAKVLTSAEAGRIRGQGANKIPPASRNNGGNFRGYKPGNNPH